MKNGCMSSGIALAVLCPASIFAATYSLEPAADARIMTFGVAYENQNFANDILSVYNVAGNRQRTLLRFDLDSIILGPGEQVHSAILTLHAATTFGLGGGQPMDIYRVTASWDESTVTWRRRNATEEWSTYGSDYIGNGSQPFASVQGNVAGPVNWDITDLVDLWVEGVFPNFGLLLLSHPGNRLTFGQAEFSNPAFHPRLTIETGTGPGRLRVSWDAATKEVILSWRGVGVAQLESASEPNSVTWSDVPGNVEVENNMSRMRLPASGSLRYFRLRELL